VNVLGAGMVTAVGSSALASCAAIRAKLTGFEEVPYTDIRSQPIIGAPVNFIASEAKGPLRLADLAVPAIAECLEQIPASDLSRVALNIGMGHPSRPGPHHRYEVTATEVHRRLGSRFSRHSRVFLEGNLSTIHALEYSQLLLERGQADWCIVGGVDSLLDARQIIWLQRIGRLKRANKPDGLIPGEAACFLCVARDPHTPPSIRISSAAIERASPEEETDVRASALSRAMKRSIDGAGLRANDVACEITDMTGERDIGVDHAIAVTRTFLEPRDRLHFWHPAMSVGAIGAAALPCAIGLAWAAAVRRFLPGSHAMCVALTESWASGAVVVSMMTE